MKTITKKINIYEFKELEKEVQDELIENTIDDDEAVEILKENYYTSSGKIYNDF